MSSRLTLPLTFANSFWTPDYRTGLEVLIAKLDEGIAENFEIVEFVKARAASESQLAISLKNSASIGSTNSGFATSDEGASLLMAFRGLQAESISQGAAHEAASKELYALVAEPFEAWCQGYKVGYITLVKHGIPLVEQDCIKDKLEKHKTMLFEQWIESYEVSIEDVARIKSVYIAKIHRADELADNAKFAPLTAYPTDTLAGSVTQNTDADVRMTPPTVASRLRDLQMAGAGAISAVVGSLGASAPASPVKSDKGKSRAFDQGSPQTMALSGSPRAMSPEPIELNHAPPAKLTVVPPSPTNEGNNVPVLVGGLSMSPSTIRIMFKKAAEELPLRPVRFGLLGEYKDCFTGQEFVNWLAKNIPGFGGDLERAEAAGKDLGERDGLLRRVGEFGNIFEYGDDTYYQFRPKAFGDATAAPSPMVATPLRIHQSLTPIGNVPQRANTLVSAMAKALNVGSQAEPAHIRAFKEAEEADREYRVAVRKLDRQRLGLEERLEDSLKTLQRWETERLRAIKTVLLQYQGTLANVPKALEATHARSATLIASYMPETDVKALIERYRTGPFHPVAQVYEDIQHDQGDVVFGINLRRWSESNWDGLTTIEEKQDKLPAVITAMLAALEDSYAKLTDDAEKRKSWIYEVPLSSIHHLREALHSSPYDEPFSPALFEKYDTPVLAGAVKLWMLELEPPLVVYESYDDIRKIYPAVGSSNDIPDSQRIRHLEAALQKLPKIHLFVLNAIIKHLRHLVDVTKVPNEDDEVYLSKLALSTGRSIVRPKTETERTLQDRHPTLMFTDLMKYYDDILPPTISKKNRESERTLPMRKRTIAVDMRFRRSQMMTSKKAGDMKLAPETFKNMPISKSEQPLHSPPISGRRDIGHRRNGSQGSSSFRPLMLGSKNFIPAASAPRSVQFPPTSDGSYFVPSTQEAPEKAAKPEFQDTPATIEDLMKLPDTAPDPIHIADHRPATFKEPDLDVTPTRPTFKEPASDYEHPSQKLEPQSSGPFHAAPDPPHPSVREPESDYARPPHFKEPEPDAEYTRPPAFKEPEPELEYARPPTFKEPEAEPLYTRPPKFKEPEPETDYTRPPAFKEPEPDLEYIRPTPVEEATPDYDAPTRPSFKELAAKEYDHVTRPTKFKEPSSLSRTPSPPLAPSASDSTSHERQGSGSSAQSAVRGPRVARLGGPRPKGPDGPNRRTSSGGLNRTGSVKTRTMDSDAENDLVGR